MDHNDNLWVERRMDALAPPQQWRPDSDAAFTRLRRRERAAHRRRVWLTLAASAAAVIVVAFLFRAPRHAPVVAPAVPRIYANFQQAGRSDAPIVCEIYSDYQCPHCADLFFDTLPRLVAEFVEPGKVRLVHRDLPLPQHSYARLAARYANAAGRIGRYDIAAAQIFRTQNSWSGTGDLDARLAEALAPGEMARVRQTVRSTDLDASIDEDLEMAKRDRVTATPAMVLVANGKRRTLAPAPPYPELKSYLDAMLSTHCREAGGTRTC
jgi:protein-disulfide isomerase